MKDNYWKDVGKGTLITALALILCMLFLIAIFSVIDYKDNSAIFDTTECENYYPVVVDFYGNITRFEVNGTIKQGTLPRSTHTKNITNCMKYYITME